MAARSPDEYARLSRADHIDLSPATDDRPFFFQQLLMTDPSSWMHALRTVSGVRRGNLAANLTLALIMTLSCTLVIATIVVPALPSIRQIPGWLAWSGTLYFLFIGLGFMFVEIGLIQRISIYLGHPVYGLAIGLFGIIVSTGLGSLLSGSVPLRTNARFGSWASALGIYLLLLPMWLPALMASFAAAALPMRAAVSLLAVIPAGILMGFGFPTGMQRVNSIDPRPAPWFWAVNGAAGVLGAALAVATSIAFSINLTLWLGAVCYLLLAAAAWGLARAADETRPHPALLAAD